MDPVLFEYLQALLTGNLPVVEAFLATTGVPVDKLFDVNGLSGAALHLASSTGQAALVSRLAKVHGAHVDLQQDDGATPLFLAAEFGHHAVVDELVAAGCNVNLPRDSGDAALHIAAEKGHPHVVARLLAAGSDPNVAQADGCTPLYFAAQSGNVRIVRLLIGAHADPDQQCRRGDTALLAAAQSGHLRVVRALLGATANSDLATAKGETALHFAAQSGQQHMVKALLAAGASADVRANNGCSPVHTSAQNGHLAVVEALLAAQADPNAVETTSGGGSPLFVAAQNGHLSVARALVRAQANVDHRPELGPSATTSSTLYIAAQEGHGEVVQLLVRAGAQVDDRIDTGESPLHIAAQQGHRVTLTALLRADGGCQVDVEQRDGCSALYLACQNGHLGAARVLLTEGRADVNLPRRTTGQSPLHAATENGHADVVEVLVAACADVCAKSSRGGLTALDVATKADPHSRVVQVLLRSQADESCSAEALEMSTTTGNGDRCVATELSEAAARQLCEKLHAAMTLAGFVKTRAALQSASADVLQEILGTILKTDEAFVVGSYSEGWGNSLSRLDGRTDVESDIDVTQLFPGRLYHLAKWCSCDEVDPELMVEYTNGHIICKGFASSPARPERGSELRPAVDRVSACRLCCYPPIGPLQPHRLAQSSIPQSVLQSLEQELSNSPCHVVHAAPPGQAGEQLRVSTTFLEKRLLRSLSSLQGQLFVTLKYLVKKVICRRVQGVKAYHAKTITFRMLEETPPDDWKKPENLVNLIRRSLHMLLESVKKSSESDDGRIMEHFFLCDAGLYLKGADHSSAQEIAEVLRDVIDELPQLLETFIIILRPIDTSARFYFHPFLILPEIDPKFSSASTSTGYESIYGVVREIFVALFSPGCCIELQERTAELLGRLPDCALTAREALGALACLKFGYRDAAVKVLRHSRGHSVSRGIDWPTNTSEVASKSTVWQHQMSCNSAWKFSFVFFDPPDLSGCSVSHFLAECFPLKMANYTTYYYVNFDALLVCLQLELGVSSQATVGDWFRGLLHRGDADLQELLAAVHYCQDPNLLRRLVRQYRPVILEDQLASSELHRREHWGRALNA